MHKNERFQVPSFRAIMSLAQTEEAFSRHISYCALIGVQKLEMGILLDYCGEHNFSVKWHENRFEMEKILFRDD